MRLTPLLAGLMLYASVASAAQGSSHDYSATVSTTAAFVMSTAQAATCTVYMRVWNVAGTGGATVWLSRSGTAAANAPGSFPLTPGNFETFTYPQTIPGNALSAVASSGTAPLTVECF